MAMPAVRKALSYVASSRNLLLLAINVYGPQAIVFKTPVTNLPRLPANASACSQPRASRL